jgi:hypothetical protein
MRKIPLLTNANRRWPKAGGLFLPPCFSVRKIGGWPKAGGFEIFFAKKNFNRLYKNQTKSTFNATIFLQKLQPAHCTNQAKRRITATPVAFLLFAKMQPPRPSATPLFAFANRGVGTPRFRFAETTPLFFLRKNRGDSCISLFITNLTVFLS